MRRRSANERKHTHDEEDPPEENDHSRPRRRVPSSWEPVQPTSTTSTQENAIESAESDPDYSGFSRQGLIEQPRTSNGAVTGRASGKRIIRFSPARALSCSIRPAQDLTMGSGVCAQNRYSRAKAGVLKRSAELPKVLARNTIHG